MWTPLLNGCITVVDGCSSIRQPVASVLWQIPVGGSQAYPTYVAHRSRVHHRRLAARKPARTYRKCDRTLYGAAGGNAASALLGQPDAFQERGKRPVPPSPSCPCHRCRTWNRNALTGTTALRLTRLLSRLRLPRILRVTVHKLTVSIKPSILKRG